MFTNFRLWLFFHRKPSINYWRELESLGWYWYQNRIGDRRGFVLSNGIESTEPLDVTSDEFLGARNRFAKAELERMNRDSTGNA